MMDNQVPFSDLKKAYLQAAQIVTSHGEKYIPIFERLEMEYKERVHQIDAVNRARQLLENKLL